MGNGLLIKDVRVLDPADGPGRQVDILIEDGLLKRIEPGLIAGGADVIDASGCVAAPGFIDIHAHLREPGMEYKEDVASGSRAAACGGYTAVFCMPNTEPAIDNSSVAEYVFDRGVDEGLCMVLPHGAITQGRKGETLAPMGEMGHCRAGVIGFSDDGNAVSDSEIMRRAMEYARTMDAVIISHSEEVSLSEGGQMNEGYYSTFLGLRGIPAEAEQIGVFRDICLAEKTGVSLHLAHLSTAGSVELVRTAKRRGLPVTCEATPHHFSLNDSELIAYDTNMKMNPPLRSQGDVEALLEAFADGTIDVIATDHAPHAPHEKETEFDRAEFGVVGLETCLALVVTRLVEPGVLSLADAVARLTAAPAGIMRMERWDYSPAVEEGAAANLVVFNPDLEWTIDSSAFKSRARNTPYEGWKVRGKVLHTVFRGRLVVRDAELADGPRGTGQGQAPAAGDSAGLASGIQAPAAASRLGE
jgi:dihydroorotase